MHLTKDELDRIVFVLIYTIEYKSDDTKDLEHDSILDVALFALIRILRIPNEDII